MLNTSTDCPYCHRAKALLAEKFPGSTIGIVELDQVDEGSAIVSFATDI